MKYTKMTYQELKAEQKKLKSFSIVNALLIGILLGVVAFSLFNNSFGWLMLIPLFFAYKLANNQKDKKLKDLNNELKKREALEENG